MISGILVVVLMLAFAGVVYWAYSSRNRERFNEAARLPLHDDAPRRTPCGHACGCQKESTE